MCLIISREFECFRQVVFSGSSRGAVFSGYSLFQLLNCVKIVAETSVPPERISQLLSKHLRQTESTRFPARSSCVIQARLHWQELFSAVPMTRLVFLSRHSQRRKRTRLNGFERSAMRWVGPSLMAARKVDSPSVLGCLLLMHSGAKRSKTGHAMSLSLETMHFEFFVTMSLSTTPVPHDSRTRPLVVDLHALFFQS